MTGDTTCCRSFFLRLRSQGAPVRRRRGHHRDGLLLWRHHEASRTSTLRASLLQARSPRRRSQDRSRRAERVRAAARPRSGRPEPPRAWRSARRGPQPGRRAPRGYGLSTRPGIRAGFVIPAGRKDPVQEQNFLRGAAAPRVFVRPHHPHTNVYLQKSPKRHRFCIPLNRQFEQSTTTDEVML